MQNIDEGTFTLKQGPVAYRRCGNPNGRPLIAFHGWLDNLCSFDRLIAQSPEYDWLCIDLPGHGLSYHPPQNTRSHWADYMDVLHELFGLIGPGPHHVVGHSLGAGLASMYAGIFPEQIASLVLIDLIGSLVCEAEKAPLRLRESVLSYARLDQTRISTYPDIQSAIKARQAVTPLPDTLLAPMITRNLIQTAGAWQWRTDKRLLCPPAIGLTEEEIQYFLKRIASPTLLIAPEQGLVLNHPIMLKRLHHMSQLKLEKTPGGHHVHMEYPESVASLMANFFSIKSIS
ncbi:MAG: alpha/beta hydrolase [Pseudomonadota bacterium]